MGINKEVAAVMEPLAEEAGADPLGGHKAMTREEQVRT